MGKILLVLVLVASINLTIVEMEGAQVEHLVDCNDWGEGGGSDYLPVLLWDFKDEWHRELMMIDK